MIFSEAIKKLENGFLCPLPGEDAQFEVAHLSREKVVASSQNSNDYKQSAVLALLYPNQKSNTTTLLLIERVSYNGHHSGQIALPGGKAEPSDNNLEQTALREFFEETGSDTTPVVMGKLTPIYIPISKFVVHPFVAYTHQKPNFNRSIEEVKTLIEWDLSELLNPGIIKTTSIQATPEIQFEAPYFDVNGKILWGATAMMLNELRRMISPK